jgi:two-component system alkaline phosphatase synthesis response regulator PhoP
MAKSILIIDDEPDIRVLLKYNLEKEGYKVIEADNGSVGIEMAEKHMPDLIILDVMMPDMDGIETCEKIKNIPVLNQTIICFLTARGEDYSQLAGFQAGADDYMTKPVKPKILVSKIAALLRRADERSTGGGDVGQDEDSTGVVLDRERYLVFKEGESISLPRKEFELLSLLMSKSGKVFKRDEIMNKVWGTEVIVGDRTIDVHIRKLRKKLGDKHIQTVKGVGYKFKH